MTNVTPESRYTPIQHCQCHLSINQATNMLIIILFFLHRYLLSNCRQLWPRNVSTSQKTTAIIKARI